MKFFFPLWKLSWPAWVPDWFWLFPWVSLCSILVGIAGFIANTILRAKAVGHPVAEWPYPLEPQMLVSGISMTSVASLTVGFNNGGVVGFWVRALRGMSLSEVHYVRESTTSMAEAMKAVKRGKALWVAWMSIIFGVVACGNAWFWSHSMYQGDVTIRHNGTLDMHITPDIMSLHVFLHGGSQFDVAHPIMGAYREYLAHKPINFPMGICENCSVDATGFGWSVTCADLVGEDYDFTPTSPVEGAQDLFIIDITDSSGPNGHSLTVNTVFKSETNCAGHYVQQRCSLAPAIVRYNLNVTGNATFYERGRSAELLEYYPLPSQSRFPNEFFPNLLFLPLEPRPFHVVQHDVRLEILTKMVRDLYNTRFGTIHRQRHWRFSDDVIDTGSSYRSHIAAGYAIKPETQKEGVLPCRMSFLSSMADIIETYQELALRISVSAAVDTGKTQPVQYWSEKAQRQWLDESNLAPFCFLMALVTSTSAISIVILMHWGFWELPREFTMSPIELLNSVAHRPNSPQNILGVLANAKDDASASKLKKFAHKWDEKNENLFVYRKCRDEKWGFEVQMEEHELEEQL